MTFLLHTTGSTLARKSAKSANAPFALRVAQIEATTFAPTLRIDGEAEADVGADR